MKISVNKLKTSILKLVIGLIIYFAPLVPLLISEPIQKGTDPNVYSRNYDIYALCLCTLLFLSWGYVSGKMGNYLASKIINNDNNESTD